MNTLLRILLASVILACFPSNSYSRDEGMIRHSYRDVKNRQIFLKTHVTSTNVHELLRPVQIKTRGNLVGSGTLVLNSNLTPRQIITSNHLFSESQAGFDFYDYYVLSPTGYSAQGHFSHVVLDSVRASKQREGIEDIAYCYPGEPKRIRRISKVRISTTLPIRMSFSAYQTETVRASSVTTGERYDIVGKLVNKDGMSLYVMLYENISGESGSGFWGEDEQLYVLTGSILATPELRKAVKIHSTTRYLTVLNRVSID